MEEDFQPKDIELCINAIYDTMHEEIDIVQDYHDRHNTPSCVILTIATLSAARAEVEAIRDQIEGKTIIEIGAGVGLLAVAMSRYAKRVYAIEVDPAWSWTFIRHIYRRKPPHLTFIFGLAEEMVGAIKGDVAVIRTRSGYDEMRKIAGEFAPEIIEL